MARARVEHDLDLVALDREHAHFTAGFDHHSLREIRNLDLPTWQWADYGRPTHLTVSVTL